MCRGGAGREGVGEGQVGREEGQVEERRGGQEGMSDKLGKGMK